MLHRNADMKSLYVSMGSDYADLEAVENFCKTNPPESLTVLLCKDNLKSKKHLTECYKGLRVTVCNMRTNCAMGLFDSSHCEWEYGSKKATKFAIYLVKLLLRMSEDVQCKVFVFNETVRIMGNVTDCMDALKVQDRVAYTASVELVKPDNTCLRYPSILSGAYISSNRSTLSQAVLKGIVKAVDAVSCVKQCSCLVDVILYGAMNEALPASLNSRAIRSQTSDSLLVEVEESVPTRARLRFVDINSVFRYARIVTSMFRCIPAADKYIQSCSSRHAFEGGSGDYRPAACHPTHASGEGPLDEGCRRTSELQKGAVQSVF